MCTMIVERAEVAGSVRGRDGWFPVTQANVSYDHPFHSALDHAINIDFVNESRGLSARVPVELTPDSARRLVDAILAALNRGESA